MNTALASSSSMVREPFGNSVQSGILPRIVRLGDELYGAAFQLMKLLPAEFMLARASEAGHLRPSTTVIETTSGSLGLGLALVCRLRGNPLVVVGDRAIDGRLRRRLEALGTRVSVVSHAATRTSSVQQARLDRVERICRRYPDHFVPHQYDNPSNPAAYGAVAELVLETLGAIDILVAPVGSGGSSCGTSSFLRAVAPELRLVGVDTPGSILFGAPPGQRMLRGLGNGVVPGVLDHTAFDEVHWIGAAEAFAATRRLHAETCLFMGPTSGAAHMVGEWVAARNPGARVLVMFPDEGHRYDTTVYNDGWLRRRDLELSELPSEPIPVAHPVAAAAPWTSYEWGRRTLAEVAAAAPVVPS